MSELEQIIHHLEPNYTVIATGTTTKGLITVVCVVTECQFADKTWRYEKWIIDQGRVTRVTSFSSQFQLTKEGVVERIKIVEA